MNSDSTAKENHWQLIALTVAGDAEETASALLFDAGTTGIVTLEESADTVKLGAYFDAPRWRASFSTTISPSRSAVRCVERSRVIANFTVDLVQLWRDPRIRAAQIGGS